jgi:hypothetical protein
MKKMMFFAVIVCLVAASVFAQSYTVDSVTGRVQRDSGGRMVDVRVGDVLTEDITVRTSIGASLVLTTTGNNTFTIPAGRNGKISDLLENSGGADGLNVSRGDTGPVSRTTGQVSTASARASMAAMPATLEEDELDPED